MSFRASPRPLLTSWLTSFVFLIFGAAGFAQGQERVTHEALWLMPRVGAPAPSPDGRWVVFSVTEPAYDENERVFGIFGSCRPTAARRRGDSLPRKRPRAAWRGAPTAAASRSSPDGKATRPDRSTSSISSGGEAVRVTSVSTGAASPQWRPDGNAILFTSRVYPGAADDEAKSARGRSKETEIQRPGLTTGFRCADWDRWLDDRQAHLLVQTLEPGAKARDLLAGTPRPEPRLWRPTTIEREELDAVWAPDGQLDRVCRDDGAQHRRLRGRRNASLSGAGRRRGTASTHDGASPTSVPRSGRDGRALFFTAADDHEQIYSLDRLAMAPWPWSGNPVLTPVFDRSVAVSWAIADGQSIYLTAEDDGLEKLYVLPASGGQVTARGRAAARRLHEPQDCDVRHSGLVANWGSAIEPAEIVRIDPVTGQHRLLTTFAPARGGAFDWQPLRHFWFTSARGKRIHNMIALPPDFDERASIRCSS